MAFNLERFISNACCNACQSFYDRYVEANVNFRSKLGMKAVIIRRQLGHCCDWCASLAGIYDPSNAPDDIYRRHSNCRCLVTYKSQDGYQDVWNKKVYQSQREARIEKLNNLQRRFRFTLDIQFFAGKQRADKFQNGWQKASLKDTIKRFMPNGPKETKKTEQKTIYISPDGIYQIVSDNEGNYFRILDSRILNSRPYVDLNGNYVHTINVETWHGIAKRTISKQEYQRLTHFINIDEK